MTNRPGFREFELDLMKAVLDQLIPCLDSMDGELLTLANVESLPEAQGIYQLIHAGNVKYIGKTDADAGLKKRLARHVLKFVNRHNIKPEDVHFKAVHIYVLTAMDVESELIKYYKSKKIKPEWNGSSFGSNDPGRERETTNKPPDGFDAQFPINIDLPVDVVPAGTHTIHEVLWRLKEALPYAFRYETTKKKSSRAYRTDPHPDYLSSFITVPSGEVTVRQLLHQMVTSLPTGWQATAFTSHIILYRESKIYKHGKRL